MKKPRPKLLLLVRSQYIWLSIKSLPRTRLLNNLNGQYTIGHIFEI